MTPGVRALAGATAAALVLVLTTGCDGADEPTATVEQGRSQAVAALQDAGSALPGASLTRLPDQDVPCTGLSSDGEERVTVGVVFEVDGLADEAAAVETLRTRWTSQGYAVEGSSEEGRAVRVSKDGMRLTYAVAAGGTRLSAAVSCLWRDGAPPR